MKGKILPKAIYVRVSTKEQAGVIQNALGFSLFLFVEFLPVGHSSGFLSEKG